MLIDTSNQFVLTLEPFWWIFMLIKAAFDLDVYAKVQFTQYRDVVSNIIHLVCIVYKQRRTNNGNVIWFLDWEDHSD